MARAKRNTTHNTLRELRRRQSLTQDDLAKRTGVARTVFTEAETGRRGLPVEVAMKAAPVLRTDGIELYLQTTVAALKASIESGRERPVKAASVARALVELLDNGTLTPSQRKAARAALEELADLVEAAAERRGAGTLAGLAPPTRDVEDAAQRTSPEGESWSETYQEGMKYLGRDDRGRREKRPQKGADAVDLDQDYNLESGEYQARFGPRKPSRKSAPQTTYEALDRDGFGRKLP